MSRLLMTGEIQASMSVGTHTAEVAKVQLAPLILLTLIH